MPYQPHPLRFQLSRKKGFKMPDGGMSVARPSKWGNPWTAAACGSVERAVQAYREDLPEMVAEMPGELEKLRGKPLGCYCPLDKPCHADVLAELANK